jgi:hypothetical protein
MADHPALHLAGTRSIAAAALTQSVFAYTTAAPHQGRGGDRVGRPAEAENVVPTFENPTLKTKHLPFFYPAFLTSFLGSASRALRAATAVSL